MTISNDHEKIKEKILEYANKEGNKIFILAMECYISSQILRGREDCAVFMSVLLPPAAGQVIIGDKMYGFYSKDGETYTDLPI